MIIVNVLGGLGNQMFQYAFAYALAQKSSEEVKLDIESFVLYELREYELELFNISLPVATIEEVNSRKYRRENFLMKVLQKLKREPKPFSDAYLKEAHFYFDEVVLNQANKAFFEGYWQSERYFKAYREDLIKEFTLKKSLHKQSKAYQEQIGSCNAISLHIRRGDYISNAHTNSVHGTCSLEYYESAVKYVEERVDRPHFFIFSDDLAWAKDNLSFIATKTFVELDDNTPDHEEMLLMSLSQHNIIANSSFSWWGAWLNQNSDKIVIAPKEWFNDTTINTKDLIPTEWVCL